MMLKTRQMLFLLICLFYMEESLSQPSDDPVFEVQQLLEITEEIKLSNHPQFIKNLSILYSQHNIFSKNQSCFFQYLKSYEILYGGQFDNAKKKIIGLLDECKDNNVYIRLNGLLANISAISGDYSIAITRLDDILPLLNEIKDPNLKHQIYQAAFIVYRLVNQDELSLKFSELMINENPPERFICKAKVNKILSIFKIPNRNINENEIKQTISFCKNNNQILYSQLLILYWLTEKMEGADSPIVYQHLLKQLKSNETLIEDTKFKNIIGIQNSLMAQLYEKLNQLELAKKYAQLAIDGSISIGQTAQKIKALQVLINYHQSQDDYKKANEYLVEKNKSEEKYYSDEQAKFMAYQTVKHDSLANNYKIKALSQENQLLQLNNQLAEKARSNQQLLNILYGITVFFFAVFAYRLIKQQRKFKRLSEYDHMTMVFNRKGIKEFMEYLLPYATKKNEVVAYIIFDLDFFKRVNDVYGHVVGDWVIKQSIEVCKELNNEKAVFARLGGEEFSIVIRDSGIDEAVAFSDQCRKAISAINTLEGSKHDFEVSASFGITTSEISGYDYTKLMTHADNALYYSKENGRNKITIFHPYTEKP